MIVKSTPFGKGLVLQAAWQLEEEGIGDVTDVAHLELNYAAGWKGDELSFLKSFSGLVSLDLRSYSWVDTTGLQACTGLRHLRLHLFNGEPLDLSPFKELEDLRILWQSSYRGLECCVGLKVLYMTGHEGTDLSVCSTLGELRHLTVASSKIKSTTGIAACHKLVFLGLGNDKQLTEVSDVEELDLRWVELQQCPRLGSVRSLESQGRVSNLDLSEMKAIESLSPVFHMQELEVLTFTGSTNILDGNLSPLKNLKRLKTVSFQDRKHYNCKRIEFPCEPISESNSVEFALGRV